MCNTGPTVLTMPEIIDETFAAVGESTADRLVLDPVSPAYRALFAEGSALDVHADPDAMAAEVAAFAGPREAQGYRGLRDWLTRLYEVEFDGFIAANFDSPLDLLGPHLASLAALGGFRRWHRMVWRVSSPTSGYGGSSRSSPSTRVCHRHARWRCMPSSPTWIPSAAFTFAAAACAHYPTPLLPRPRRSGSNSVTAQRLTN